MFWGKQINLALESGEEFVAGLRGYALRFRLVSLPRNTCSVVILLPVYKEIFYTAGQFFRLNRENQGLVRSIRRIAPTAAERGFATGYFILRRVRRSERDLGRYRYGLVLAFEKDTEKRVQKAWQL
jgi:hypothetical protein